MMIMVKRKDPLFFYKFISILAIIVALIAVVQPYFSFDATTISPENIQIPELSTDGYTKVDIDVSASENVGVVSIQGNCYQLTATTELSQIESIANGMQGKVGYRPNTHDLFKDALDSLDIDILMVKIVDMQNNTFLGRLILKQGSKIVSLDSRPSDGIGIAVRTGAPIYIKDDLLKSQGKSVC